MFEARSLQSTINHQPSTVSDIGHRTSEIGPGTWVLGTGFWFQYSSSQNPHHQHWPCRGTYNRLAQRRYRERERAARGGPRCASPRAPHHSVGVRRRPGRDCDSTGSSATGDGMVSRVPRTSRGGLSRRSLPLAVPPTCRPGWSCQEREE